MFIANLHRQLVDRRERGDTLVEVLIAIAVVSLVLGGAYATTNRSLLASRDAQERGNALKLAQSQLEQVKGLAATDPAKIFAGAAPSSFCITDGNIVHASTQAECAMDGAGNPTTNEPKYQLAVVRTGNNFTVTNRWANVHGDSTNQVQLKYRAYQ
jgi:prepilin-type N-terminal cleavage/methylation domain-containing protein